MADDFTMQSPRASQDAASCFNGNLSQIVETLQLPESSLPECDGLFRQLTHGEKVDRYSTVFVRFVSSAGAAAGGDLRVAPAPDAEGDGEGIPNPTYEFFFTGLNDSANTGGHLYSDAPAADELLPGEGAPWPLSQADTDGLKATSTNVVGANLTSDERVDFYVAALQVKFAGLYTAETWNPAGALDGGVVRESPAFADREAGSYIRRILRLLFRHATLRVVREGAQFSKQTLDYRLGPIGDYPAYNEFYGDGALSSGTPVPFAFKQLPLPLLMGRAPKLVNQNRFRIFLDIDSRFVVENDTTNQVPGGLSGALTAQSAFANSLFVGVRLDIIGGMICIDASGRPTRKLVGQGATDRVRAFEALSDAEKAAILARAGV